MAKEKSKTKKQQIMAYVLPDYTLELFDIRNKLDDTNIILKEMSALLRKQITLLETLCQEGSGRSPQSK